MRYRPADVAGGTYFFTVNLAERNRTLLVEHADVLRAVIQKVKAMHPFHIDAMVILPDHLHALWTLPMGDSDYPKPSGEKMVEKFCLPATIEFGADMN